MSGKFDFAIDRGGTFTDVLCICPNGKVRTLKLLSVDPDRYSDAPREGIRRILAEVCSALMDFLGEEKNVILERILIIFREFCNTFVNFVIFS